MKYISILCLLVCMACASARATITKYDKEGNIESVNVIRYNVVGRREANKVDLNLNTGKVKIGSAGGSAGDLAKSLLNLTEIAKKIPIP